jgi:hypothetical protein
MHTLISKASDSNLCFSMVSFINQVGLFVSPSAVFFVKKEVIWHKMFWEKSSLYFHHYHYFVNGQQQSKNIFLTESHKHKKEKETAFYTGTFTSGVKILKNNFWFFKERKSFFLKPKTLREIGKVLFHRICVSSNTGLIRTNKDQIKTFRIIKIQLWSKLQINEDKQASTLEI